MLHLYCHMSLACSVNNFPWWDFRKLVFPAVNSHIMARVFGLLASVDRRLPNHSLVQAINTEPETLWEEFWDVFSASPFVGGDHPGSGRLVVQLCSAFVIRQLEIWHLAVVIILDKNYHGLIRIIGELIFLFNVKYTFNRKLYDKSTCLQLSTTLGKFRILKHEINKNLFSRKLQAPVRRQF